MTQSSHQPTLFVPPRFTLFGSTKCAFGAIFLGAGCLQAATITLPEFGPTTYTTTASFNGSFRSTSTGVSYDVGTYDSQVNVVRNFDNKGNRVYASDGATSGNSTVFNISTEKVFQTDFYIENLGTLAAPNSRVAVAGVNLAETHSLVGNFFIQSKDDIAQTATGILRFEDFNFTLNNSRNIALSPNSSSFSLDRGTWYRLALTFSDYSAGFVDATVAVSSLTGRGGTTTGTMGTLTHSDLNLATYFLNNEMQYGLLPGVSGGGMRFQFDQFSVVPEPHTFGLLSVALVTLLAVRRRRMMRGHFRT